MASGGGTGGALNLPAWARVSSIRDVGFSATGPNALSFRLANGDIGGLAEKGGLAAGTANNGLTAANGFVDQPTTLTANQSFTYLSGQAQKAFHTLPSWSSYLVTPSGGLLVLGDNTQGQLPVPNRPNVQAWLDAGVAQWADGGVGALVDVFPVTTGRAFALTAGGLWRLPRYAANGSLITPALQKSGPVAEVHFTMNTSAEGVLVLQRDGVLLAANVGALPTAPSVQVMDNVVSSDLRDGVDNWGYPLAACAVRADGSLWLNVKPKGADPRVGDFAGVTSATMTQFTEMTDAAKCVFETSSADTASLFVIRKTGALAVYPYDYTHGYPTTPVALTPTNVAAVRPFGNNHGAFLLDAQGVLSTITFPNALSQPTGPASAVVASGLLDGGVVDAVWRKNQNQCSGSNATGNTYLAQRSDGTLWLKGDSIPFCSLAFNTWVVSPSFVQVTTGLEP